MRAAAAFLLVRPRYRLIANQGSSRLARTEG
jgi:hypothetical protein